MADIASLGLKIDSSEAGKASKDLDALVSASRKAEAAVDSLRRQSEPGFGAVQAAAKRAGVSVDEMRQRMANAHQNLAKNFPQFVKVQQDAAVKAEKATKDLVESHDQLDQSQKRTESSGRNLANTLTRRVVFAYIASQARAAAAAIADLNGQIARAGDIGKLTGIGSGGVQGIISAAGTKGIGGDAMSAALVAFNQQLPLAKAGVGELGQLLRVNKITVSDTGDAFFKVADLVARAKDDTARLSILQQAGLPATMEMVRLMSQGGDALKLQIAQTAKLTESQVEVAQRIRDAWATYWQQWKDNATLAIADVLGKLGGLAQAARNATASDRDQRVRQGVVDYINGRRADNATPNSLVSGAFGALGNGTGGSESLQAALQKKANSLSGQGDTRDWATEKAIAQDRINKAQQYLGLLGATTTATEARRAVELQLQAAGLNGVGIDAKRAEILKTLAYEQNLGITAIKASTDAENVAAATIGMSTGAAAAYTAAQNALNEAKRNGKEVTDAQKAAIEAEAETLGRARQRADDLRFEYDTFSGAMREVGSNLRQGQSLWVAFGNAGANALGKIADRLMDMASQGLWNAAFGGKGGGGIGGLFSSLFGGGGGGAGPIAADGLAAIRHSGYGPGDRETAFRRVPASTFDNAPRFHSGIGPGERAAIIRNDESVLTPGQMRQLAPAGSGAGPITITNHNDFRGADPGSEARIKAYVDQSSQRAVQQAVEAVSRTHRTNPSYLGSRQ